MDVVSGMQEIGLLISDAVFFGPGVRTSVINRIPSHSLSSSVWPGLAQV